MTKFVKKAGIQSNWFEIDATDAVVGRIATVVSKIIRGKNKTSFNCSLCPKKKYIPDCTPNFPFGSFTVATKNLR